MQRYFLCLIMGILASIQVSFAAPAGSSAIPDLKGVWVVEGGGIRHVYHESDKAKAEQEPKFGNATEGPYELLGEQQIIIDEQDGYRFSGTRISKKVNVKISAVIGFDNKSIYIAKKHGPIFCQLVSVNKMECAGVSARKYGASAFRYTLTREKH